MSDHYDPRGKRPPPGFRFFQWGAPLVSGVGGALMGLQHYVIGATLLVFGAVYVFVGWPLWARWYDRRLIAAGVVIDRSEWFRREMLAGDRQAKWLSLTLVALLLAFGIGLLAVAIAIAT